MEIQLSDLIDRYTILLLKAERLQNEEINEELNECKGAIDKVVSNWIETLYNINGQIWDLEADIRNGKEGKLGLEEVGHRALLIRDLNKKRIEMKNKISVNGFREIKIKHLSQ